MGYSTSSFSKVFAVLIVLLLFVAVALTWVVLNNSTDSVPNVYSALDAARIGTGV